jgi:hypothetical protein
MKEVVLYASPLNVKANALYCSVLNVSRQPRSGTLQIFSGDGSSLAVGSYNNVAPGGSTGIAVYPPFPGPAPVMVAYAKVTVEGSKTDIRANLTTSDPNGDTVAVAEAR